MGCDVVAFRERFINKTRPERVRDECDDRSCGVGRAWVSVRFGELSRWVSLATSGIRFAEQSGGVYLQPSEMGGE